jgi:hypothetical protein
MHRMPELPHLSVIAATAKLSTVYVFAAAMLAQTLHYSEHVVQLYQHAVLGLSISQSHGLVYFLDFEWNHFVFNSAYFLALGVVFLQCKFYQIREPAGGVRFASLAFTTGFFVQGYHVIEHSVRIVQFYQTGCTPCPGILGRYFDGVYLHFLFNSVVYVLPLIAFIAYGFHVRLKYPFSGRAKLLPESPAKVA